MESNPWSSNGLLLGMKLGDPQSGIVLSRRCGLVGGNKIQMRQYEVQMAQHSSVQLIRTVQEVSKLNQALQEIEFQLYRHLLDNESKDLLHLDVLEQRLQSVEKLLSHFTALLASKEQILNHLQSSTTENSLMIEAPYHKQLFNIVQSISPSLSDFPSNISRIVSAASLDIMPLKSKMRTAVKSLIECKEMSQNCWQLHTHNHTSH